MTWTLETLRAKLREVFGTEPVDPEVFSNAVREEFQPLYQHIFNAGHKVSDAQNGTRISGLEAQLDAATKARTKAEKDLAKLSESQPDVAKIRSDYDTQITQLNEQLEATKTQHRAKLNAVLIDRAKTDLVSLLVSAPYKVDPLIADSLATKHAALLRPNEQTDTIEVLADVGSTVAIQSKEPLKTLAESLAKTVDAKYRSADVDTGSGTKGGQGGTGNVFDKVREDAKKERETAAKSATGGSELDTRLAKAGV